MGRYLSGTVVARGMHASSSTVDSLRRAHFKRLISPAAGETISGCWEYGSCHSARRGEVASGGRSRRSNKKRSTMSRQTAWPYYYSIVEGQSAQAGGDDARHARCFRWSDWNRQGVARLKRARPSSPSLGTGMRPPYRSLLAASTAAHRRRASLGSRILTLQRHLSRQIVLTLCVTNLGVIIVFDFAAGK